MHVPNVALDTDGALMLSNAAVVCRSLLHIVGISEAHNRDAQSPLRECMHATYAKGTWLCRSPDGNEMYETRRQRCLCKALEEVFCLQRDMRLIPDLLASFEM